MGRFRKKPVEIEAVQWDGQNIDAVLELVDFEKLPPELAEGPGGPGIGQTATGELSIPTLNGWVTARPGDWILKGTEGEVYPCVPAAFEASYEPVGTALEQAMADTDRALESVRAVLAERGVAAP